MSGIRIWKAGENKIVDKKKLERFLEQGWTTDPTPKMSVSVEATADVIEAQPQDESSEEEYAWHDQEEIEDLDPVDDDEDDDSSNQNEGDN